MIQILALLAAFVPAILWLWFFTSRDRYEREPKSLLIKLFLWGLLAGPWAAGLNELLGGLFGPLINQTGKAGAIPLAIGMLAALVFVLALNEETMKFLVASGSIRNDPNFNEPADGIIYLTSAALGFAAGENFMYIMGAFASTLKAAAGASAPPEGAITQAFIAAFGVMAPLRSLLSATGHVTWSGITGYFLARHVVGKGSKRLVTLGVLLAAVGHTAYNFPQFLQGAIAPNAGFFSRFFLITLLVWVASLAIYFALLRRSLAASPFRTRQLGGQGVLPATPAAPAGPASATPTEPPVKS
jgi:RsiW-degrading membrane proteinase PrsW (M82 family)